MRFRKKPVEIEARRVPVWDSEVDATSYLQESIDLEKWCDGTSYMMLSDDQPSPYTGIEVVGPHIVIPTLEGAHAAMPGDWIIEGVQGEFYPCKPDIFEVTYEPVVLPIGSN